LDWQAYFNPPMPKMDRRPSPKAPPLGKWDESLWDRQKIDSSKQLVKMNEVMWNALDGLEGIDGKMLIRIGQSILDHIGDENKCRGVARMMHSVTEFASAYKTQER
jgi:hypothetical protein